MSRARWTVVLAVVVGLIGVVGFVVWNHTDYLRADVRLVSAAGSPPSFAAKVRVHVGQPALIDCRIDALTDDGRNVGNGGFSRESNGNDELSVSGTLIHVDRDRLASAHLRIACSPSFSWAT